jgi:S1-C subfamily serine protease
MKVTVGDLADSARLLSASVEERLGATVRPLQGKTAAQFGLEPGHGVELVKIDKDGPLDKAGFEVGDLILAVNGQPVTGPADFGALIGSLRPGQKVALLAVDHRGGGQGNVLVTTR